MQLPAGTVALWSPSSFFRRELGREGLQGLLVVEALPWQLGSSFVGQAELGGLLCLRLWRAQLPRVLWVEAEPQNKLAVA